MSVKSKIKDLASEHHISIAELERKLDFANGSISKWDKQSPSSERLSKVADYFNVSTDYILGRNPKEDDLKTADLADDDTIFTYKGQPLSDDDKEIIRRLMNGK